MNNLGQGIGFAVLVFSTAWLEINDKPVNGLWFLVVLWAVLADWSDKK